ncbi:MAG: DUF4389 domain-containing protein [Actinobacteria bacterium]|nr:DUF4389 domain-containing protein [Actinomycetota bacterium]
MSTPPASPAAPAAPSGPAPYPVDLDVQYPTEPRNRVTVLFRVVLAVPVVLLLALFQGTSVSVDTPNGGALLGGFLFLPTLLLLLFRHRYPRWWFDFNVQLLALVNRISVYLLLLRDEYPSTEDRQALDLRVPYPDAKTALSRGLPLVKWLLAIPHYIVLVILSIGVVVAVIIAWFAIVLSGRCPRGIHDFVVGYLRWSARVYCYALLLTTDRYPPFRLAS